MELPRAPFVTYEEAAAKAEEFLLTHSPSGGVPVDIERIVEFSLKLDIVPVRGLIDEFDVDGFLGMDFHQIFVDEGIMLRFPTRYRFTLAHEVGHLILHADAFSDLSIGTLAEWLEFYRSVDEQDQGWFERQAYWFAGAVLVPETALIDKFDGALSQLDQAGVDSAGLSRRSRSAVAGRLAKSFAVSTGVIERRLREVGLW